MERPRRSATTQLQLTRLRRTHRDRHKQLRRDRDLTRLLQADPQLELGRGDQAGDDQLPHAEAREGRPVLRAHLRSDEGLGVLLRQVQARALQGHRVRALRRGGHALEGAPRAHGPRRPGRAGQPHLVLQGRAQPDRLPAGHGAEGTREGPVLRRVDHHLGRRRGAHEGPRLAGEGGQQGARRLRGRTRGAGAGAARVAQAPGEVPANGKQTHFSRRRPPVGGLAGHQPREDLRRGAREARQRAAQVLRRRHRRHRGLHRGRRRADAQRLGAVQDDGAQADRARRDDLPRAEGALRLLLRLRRVLPRRDGRRSDPRPAAAGRSRGRTRRARGSGQDRQRPEAGPRGQAPEGRQRVPAVGEQARKDGARRRPGDPAGAAPDGAARRRALRHLGPERPLPPRDQPQQPPQAAARPRRARDHRQQREADAAGGRRRAVRQRPPWASGHRTGQPSAEVAVGHAQGQAGTLPSEPARQARGLLRALGDRRRAVPEAAPVRPAEDHGAGAVQAVHHGPPGRAQVRAEHQGGQEDGRLGDRRGVGRARGGHPRAPGAAEPRADAAPSGHPGVRAAARRGQGDPGAPAGLSRVQRRLRRRPDGCASAALGRGAGGGAHPDAVLQQHPVPRARSAAGDPDAGHDPRRLLPDLRSGGRGAGEDRPGDVRAAPARVPHRAGGRALLRGRRGQAARHRRVPSVSGARAATC